MQVGKSMWGRVRSGGSLWRLRNAAGVLMVAGVSGFLLSTHPADGEGLRAADAPVPARQQELIHMVRHDCGSCHGLTLAGGLGPALVRGALQNKPVEYIQAMILRGRPGTAMPGWQGLLSEQDANWVASQLREGFPDER
jgi:cytochrome c55X